MSLTAQICNETRSLASWARQIKRSALQEMLSQASRPGIISFALGLPAPELFPAAEISEAVESVVMGDRRALQYGPPSQPLKKHIVSLMARRGVDCVEEHIFITAGAQQGMNLLTRLLLDQGGQVMMEELTYTGFQQVLEPFQPQVLTVPTDEQTGIDVEAVESLLAEGARPAFIYVMTDGHNPLGVSMSMEKRRRLVELARAHRIQIMEDDAYGFLQYGETSRPPLRGLDQEWVFYLGSFSKILAPALRVGWIVLPEELMSKLSVIKEATDIDTATLTQRSVAAYLDRAQLDDHLTRLRSEYRLRRDTMLENLRLRFPPGARWNVPANGVFVWVKLPEGVDADTLLKAAIETQGVAFIPGSAFSVGDKCSAANCLRLNFSYSPPETIEEGIKRLGKVVESAFNRSVLV